MVRKCGLPIFDEDTRGWILCTNEMAARDGRSVLFFQVAGGTHNTIGEEHAAFSYNELLYPGKPMPQFYVMQQGAHKRCCLTCNALFRKAFNAAMNLLAEDDKPRENTPGDMLAAYRPSLPSRMLELPPLPRCRGALRLQPPVLPLGVHLPLPLPVRPLVPVDALALRRGSSSCFCSTCCRFSCCKADPSQ